MNERKKNERIEKRKKERKKETKKERKKQRKKERVLSEDRKEQPRSQGLSSSSWYKTQVTFYRSSCYQHLKSYTMFLSLNNMLCCSGVVFRARRHCLGCLCVSGTVT